jgi:hypothetical protein
MPQELFILMQSPVIKWPSSSGYTHRITQKLKIPRLTNQVGWGDVDWIGLAKDRNRWRAVVNSVLNLWVP